MKNFYPRVILMVKIRFWVRFGVSLEQARRQDSVTGGGRNKFWGGTRSLFVWIQEGHGSTRNLFQCGSNEQRENHKKGLQFKNFHKFWLSSQNSCDFSRILKWRPKKKVFVQKFFEIRCESTKITKIRAVNTHSGVLGLDLLSNSLELVNVVGAQFSLGGTIFVRGAQAVIWGGALPRNAPPWRRAWFRVRIWVWVRFRSKLKIKQIKISGEAVSTWNKSFFLKLLSKYG